MCWDPHHGGEQEGKAGLHLLAGPQQAAEVQCGVQGAAASLGCLSGFSQVLAQSRRT